MPTLSWNDALSLDMPELDRTHHDFVVQVGALEHALAVGTRAQAAAALDRLAAQTAQHFALEERWMAALGHADSAHVYQHQAVLNVLREVQRLFATEGDRDLLRRLVAGLALWFPAHTEAMDASLVQAVRVRRLDPSVLHPAAPADADADVTSPGALTEAP